MAKKLKKSIILPIFILIFLIFSALILVGCGKDKPEPKEIKFVSDEIHLFLGQEMSVDYEISPKGAEADVIFYTSDPQTVEIDEFGRITGQKYGTAKIKVEIYGTEISDIATVIVDDGIVTSLVLDYSSTKTQYFKGEHILPENIVITGSAEFATGVKKTLTQSEFTIDYPEIADENCFITVTYLNKTIKIPIEILENNAEVKITTSPSRNVYLGESFNPEGMIITKTYRNGENEVVNDYTYDKEPVTLDTKFINIYCDGFAPLPFEINVCAKRVVRNFADLQAAINEKVESIEILGVFSTSTELQISYNESLTIFARKNSLQYGINGTGENAPIKIEGQFEKITFIGLVLSSNIENIVDLSACESGTIVFENVTFSCSREKVCTSCDNTKITIEFNNCTFLDEN